LKHISCRVCCHFTVCSGGVASLLTFHLKSAILSFSGSRAADVLFSSLQLPSVRACCSMIRGYVKVYLFLYHNNCVVFCSKFNLLHWCRVADSGIRIDAVQC